MRHDLRDFSSLTRQASVDRGCAPGVPGIGELGTVDLKWNGWRLRNGVLISEDGGSFTPGQVRAIPFMQMQIDSYKRDQRSVRQADSISGEWRPAPEQEDIASVA